MKHFLTLHFFIFLAFCADISVLFFVEFGTWAGSLEDLRKLSQKWERCSFWTRPENSGKASDVCNASHSYNQCVGKVMLRAQKFHPRHRSKMHNGILYFINERIAFLKKVIELVFTGYWNALVRDRNSENSTEAWPERNGFWLVFLTSSCVIWKKNTLLLSRRLIQQSVKENIMTYFQFS